LVNERVQVPLPEVSSERYYTVTSELNIGYSDFSSSSLLMMFRPTEPEAEDEEEQIESSEVIAGPVEIYREEVNEVESSKKRNKPIQGRQITGKMSECGTNRYFFMTMILGYGFQIQ
jgi:hypothetical protein